MGLQRAMGRLGETGQKKKGGGTVRQGQEASEMFHGTHVGQDMSPRATTASSLPSTSPALLPSPWGQSLLAVPDKPTGASLGTTKC